MKKIKEAISFVESQRSTSYEQIHKNEMNINLVFDFEYLKSISINPAGIQFVFHLYFYANKFKFRLQVNCFFLFLM